MRSLAGKIDEELPGMAAPQHLRDAAHALESGNHDGAKRHLQAAMHTMTPMSLMRHGVLDDDGQSKAKVNMDLINRHHLLVSDLQDGESHNESVKATPATFTQPSNLPLGSSMNPTKLPGAAGPDGGPGFPKSTKAAMVPAPKQNTGTDRAVAGGPKAPSRTETQLPGRPMPQAVLSWSDLDRLIELSTRTGMLAVTPAPYGKPGGPGLYGVKGQKHSDYFEQIVKALMDKRGMSKGQASAVAWGALRRWRAKSKHGEVRAAAAGALADEATKHGHAHSITWGDVVRQIELTGTAAGAAQDPRTVLGTFGSGGSAPAGAQTAQQKAAKKAQLLAQAAQDRALAAEYGKMLVALGKAKAATAKKAATATAAATAAGATGKTASATPAKKTTPAKQTPASIAHAKFKAATSGMSKGDQGKWLQQQVKSTLAQAAALTKQAAAL
jgi:hypothetical protein